MSLKYIERSLSAIKPAPPVSVSVILKTNTGIICSKETKQMQSASIIKLFILASAYHFKEIGKLSLTEKIRISTNGHVKGSGVISYLTDVPFLTYQQLLELMIIVSDNTASNYLIDRLGISNIQAFIESLGCQQTRLERKFMDVEAQKLGKENVTSALDVLRLFDIFTEKNNFLGENSQQHILHILNNQQFNSKLTAFTEYNPLVTSYHKTGELKGVEHDAAIFLQNNKFLKVVVLTEGWENNGDGQAFIASFGKVLHRFLQQDV
ncbi:class A beta-lactamase-related serine hydrolase [Oceanobacillus kimchii]|uniref:serine hydrolase n=1 Tax=Oceanobacillus kimchii TaxID=746691 RepID=UPI000378C3C5|nr:serine hydrolase [Oceanobacillus kimchii]MCT1576723.1 class A beta-lactamase-related serine hydrolase [Oceanobacillus kimchii]MCT2134793.1 class A beta-lactamase-related serine hydrolase [Oceanobacillus kimchii]